MIPAEPILPHDALRLRIDQAWMSLQEAKIIDVRPSLAVLAKEKATEWFAETMPRITDIRTITGALNITLSQLRGELLIAEGEQRGKDKVVDSTTLTQLQKDERSKDRAIAKRWGSVKAYMKAEVEAQRVPSRHGALVHIGKSSYVPAKTRLTRPKSSKSPTSSTPKRPSTDERLLARLEQAADGQRRSDRDLARVVGDVLNFLKYVRFIPWLSIDRTPDGTMFTVDAELRAICEARAPRPDLEGFTVRGFLKQVRVEIARQRKEANDLYRKANWKVHEVNALKQSELLNWIEDQLDRIP